MAEREGVFISYRRDDSAAHAGRLFDRISDKIGEEFVFMDVDSIEPGVNFFEAIDGALSRCKVLLVVIGPKWLDATDSSGRRRIDDPRDFVRLEIETALRRGIRVIPVLIDGAALPRSNQLPAALVDLTYRQAVEVSHAQFRSDSRRLVEGVARIVSPSAGDGPRTAAASTPNRESVERMPPQLDAWSATLIKTGWTRVLKVQLTHESHLLGIKSGAFAYTITVDGTVVFKRTTNDMEVSITFPISDGAIFRAAGLWVKVSSIVAVIQKTRLTVDDRVIYDG
jgi:hypothetical protein